jgi:tetratricopeptide (TPR) repeat protein
VDKHEFDAVVDRAEQYARDNPAAYRLQVVGLGLLGYAYVSVILAGLIAGMVLLGYLALHGGAILAAKLFVAVLVLVIVVLRAFWIRIPAPAGRPLTQNQAPRLFGFIDQAQSAAEILLGKQRAVLAAEIDARWQRDVADWWAKAHAAHGDSRKRRDGLEKKATKTTLSLDEQLELARLHLSNDDYVRARPLLEAVLATAPQNADAHAHLGALLARSNESTAIEHLQLAIRYDRQWTIRAGQILHAQLLQAGQHEEAKTVLKTMQDFRPRMG